MSPSAVHPEKMANIGVNEYRRYGRFEIGSHPLTHRANDDPDGRVPVYARDSEPDVYRPPASKFANAGPLGLSCVALIIFVDSLINLQARGIHESNIVTAIAYAYGGLVMLLAGMWDMASGDTFGATCLSSYGGFWISLAIIDTPSFKIASTLLEKDPMQFYNSFGIFLLAWMIFTCMLTVCTVKSDVVTFSLFLILDVVFALLASGYFLADPVLGPQVYLIKAAGGFGIIVALLAWYAALATLADNSNSFFVLPLGHFSWSETGREQRRAAKQHGFPLEV